MHGCLWTDLYFSLSLVLDDYFIASTRELTQQSAHCFEVAMVNLQ